MFLPPGSGPLNVQRARRHEQPAKESMSTSFYFFIYFSIENKVIQQAKGTSSIPRPSLALACYHNAKIVLA